MTGDDISQCDREIAACADYDGPDLVGALMGWADWTIEKELIMEEIERMSSACRTWAASEERLATLTETAAFRDGWRSAMKMMSHRIGMLPRDSERAVSLLRTCEMEVSGNGE